ncbi:MAG: hypothetical protein R3C49_16295 [Planctomycetaceae bacterium]
MTSAFFRLIPLSMLIIHTACATEPPRVSFSDPFTNTKCAERRAIRGDWKIADGVAECVQDDELYKKYKDHGPIIFYDLKYTDAKVSFQVKPEAAKTIVFTANGEDGHVFRFILTEAFVSVRAFPPESKEKSISLAREEHPLKQSEWIPVVVTLQGTKATVRIGSDFEQTWEHPSLARPKTNLSVGFSFGKLSVRNLVVE